MAKTKPLTPSRLPAEGGTYLLDPATGEWVKVGVACEPAAPMPETVTTNDDGTANAEAPAAGED